MINVQKIEIKVWTPLLLLSIVQTLWTNEQTKNEFGLYNPLMI